MKYCEAKRAVERDRQREFYASQRDTVVERQRIYDEEHRNEIVERQRIYDEAHREEIVERQRRYNSTHRNEILEKQARRRQDGAQSTAMTGSCQHCQALLWTGERNGLCCMDGKVKIFDINFFHPPEPLQSLFLGLDRRSVAFLKNIRAYNSALQMSSLGMNEIRLDGWNPNIRIQGQMYHRMGTLLPAVGEQPKFSQIYFCQEELDTRLSVFDNLDRNTLQELQEMLHRENAYIRSLRLAKELVEAGNYSDTAKIVIHEDLVPAGEHERRFNRPHCHEVYALLPSENLGNSRDVVLHVREGGGLQRISETSPAYDCVQYPLLLPTGTGGWSLELQNREKHVTPAKFYAFQMMIRPDGFNLLLRARCLFQLYIVDAYSKIETIRLNYLKLNQNQLKAERYQGLQDALAANDTRENIGNKVILPSTYPGSPRNMAELQQDGMANVRKFGKPDLFITYTCSPKDEMIVENLLPGQEAPDRPDITSRVFNLRVSSYISDKEFSGYNCCGKFSVYNHTFFSR